MLGVMAGKNIEFLKDLKALLEKHNAVIGWRCADSSDMHGIHGQYMYMQIAKEPEYRLNHENEVSARDLPRFK